MDTLDILWGRVRGGLTDADYSDWATNLLLSGHDSREVALLAANVDGDWEYRERLFAMICEQLGTPVPTTKSLLLEMVESRMIEKYRSGEISGVVLVQRCRELWVKSNYDKRFSIWEEVEEDICLIEEDNTTVFFEVDRNDIEGSIRRILDSQGLLKERDKSPSTPTPPLPPSQPCR